MLSGAERREKRCKNEVKKHISLSHCVADETPLRVLAVTIVSTSLLPYLVRGGHFVDVPSGDVFDTRAKNIGTARVKRKQRKGSKSGSYILQHLAQKRL